MDADSCGLQGMDNVDWAPRPGKPKLCAPWKGDLSHIPASHSSSYIGCKQFWIISQHGSCFMIEGILMIWLLHKQKRGERIILQGDELMVI